MESLCFLMVIGLIACFMGYVFAFMGDWRELAERFRAGRRPVGRYRYFQTGAVGAVGYNRMLSVGVTKEGLYLAVFFPFRWAHPPLLIPWSEIHDVQVAGRRWWRTCRLSIGQPEFASVTLRGKAMKQVQQKLDGAA